LFINLDFIDLHDGDTYVSQLYDVPGMYIRKDETRELVYTLRQKVEDPKLKVRALLSPASGITFTLDGTITKEENATHTRRYGKTIYKYSFNAEEKGLKASTYYTRITTYSFGGEDFHGSLGDGKDEFGFYSDQDIDVSTIQIKGVTFFEGNKNSISKFISTLVQLGLIIVGIVILSIVAVVVIIVVVVTRKKKKAA